MNFPPSTTKQLIYNQTTDLEEDDSSRFRDGVYADPNCPSRCQAATC